jgi:hypothetical protein
MCAGVVQQIGLTFRLHFVRVCQLEFVELLLQVELWRRKPIANYLPNDLCHDKQCNKHSRILV